MKYIKVDNFVYHFWQYSNLLLVVLSLVLLISGISKLMTLRGTVEELYKWLIFTPVGMIDYDYLKIIIVSVSVIEIILGIVLFSPGIMKVYALYCTILFLFIMFLISGVQWASGFESCGCFGQVLNIPPGVTIIKNLFLLSFSLITVKACKLNASNG